MSNPGFIVKDFRESLNRPVWSNCNRNPDIHPYPSARDMCAIINYCLKKRGINRRVPLRTYNGWEIGRYPLWFRAAMVWICNDIRHVVNTSWNYEIMKGDEYQSVPMVDIAQ